MKKKLLMFGMRLASLAVVLATMSQFACRGWWSQPKEPEDLEIFIKGYKGLV